ncbi:hypothetical protein TSAR_006578 [Trichomalopsis sarcophagae]|uniref:Odorant receptor n=1 Tax=Trichomalopsis sarcophagae TaxID=543379 RepID=A0A232FC33_9HYME|nr:hypothetical protein TSAR_006578 [Trichomalopsis sarcophagae]
MSSEPKIFDNPLLARNKTLLIHYGLWPYQSKLARRCKYSLFSITSISLIIPMLQGLTDDTSTDIVIFFETLVATLMVFGGFVQCLIMYARENKMRNLFNEIDANWCKLTDYKEREIFLHFARRGRALVTLFTVSTISCYFVFMIMNNIPTIVGEATNDASKTFPYYSKRWIIDERLRNLQIFLHVIIVTFYSGMVYIVAITTYIYSIKHFCGIYAIVALKNLTSTRRVMPRNTKYDVLSELFDIVNKHKEAIKGVRSIGSIFRRSFFVIEICFLCAFAMILFDIHSNLFNLRLLLRICFVASIFFMHTFYINYGGEMVIHFSDKIRMATFFIQWYSIPSDARKVLVTIMQRCQRPDTLGWIHMTYSNANLIQILRSSWSMAAVLIAVHDVK